MVAKTIRYPYLCLDSQIELMFHLYISVFQTNGKQAYCFHVISRFCYGLWGWCLECSCFFSSIMYFSFVKLPSLTLRCKCWRAEDAQLKDNSETTAADPTYCIFSKSSPKETIWIKNRVLSHIYKAPKPRTLMQSKTALLLAEARSN